MEIDTFEFKGLDRGNVIIKSSGKQLCSGISGMKASQESSSGALSGTAAREMFRFRVIVRVNVMIMVM